MRKSQFSPEQNVKALRQAEGGTVVGEIVRKLGMTEATFYRWKKQYAGLDVGELRELRALREENAKLRGVVADLTLDKTILKEALAKKMVALRPWRAAVGWARGAYHVSEPRACRAFAVERSAMRYQSRKAPDTALRRRLHELTTTRITFG